MYRGDCFTEILNFTTFLGHTIDLSHGKFLAFLLCNFPPVFSLFYCKLKKQVLFLSLFYYDSVSAGWVLVVSGTLGGSARLHPGLRSRPGARCSLQSELFSLPAFLPFLPLPGSQLKFQGCSQMLHKQTSC